MDAANANRGVNVIHGPHPDFQLGHRQVQLSPSLSNLILIGTSTGGPKALSELFQRLPVLPHTACCVVQHMPAGFTRNLARRIQQISSWSCQEAQHQEPLQSGFAYIAPGGFQTRLEQAEQVTRFSVEQTGPFNGHEPSVDVLFESALALRKLRLVGVLMTGMGADGAKGLQKLHDLGYSTVAESEQTCIVYGMPRVAVQLGAVDRIVPLPEIAEALMELIGG